VLVYSQILKDLLSDRLLILLTLLLCSYYKTTEDLVESGMASLD
jgi:hypothetical protein